MLQGNYNPNYRGGLNFGSPYPIFEGDQCFQYLQEYVPLHLPQINRGLENCLEYYKNKSLTISVLDIGSGPATVALAFCKQLNGCDEYGFDIGITTIEASDTFNQMIEKFNEISSNKNIVILQNFNCTFTNIIENRIAEKNKGEYDWVIIANFLSGIGKSVDDVNRKLNRLLAGLLNPRQKIMLTIIETGLSFPKNCIDKLGATGFEDIRIKSVFQAIDKQPIDASWLKNCNFYRTDPSYPKYKPYVNSKSLLLELKEDE